MSFVMIFNTMCKMGDSARYNQNAVPLQQDSVLIGDQYYMIFQNLRAVRQKIHS